MPMKLENSKMLNFHNNMVHSVNYFFMERCVAHISQIVK